ncbi:MAG: NAD(P)-binding protein [Deltaproteobacteria bacterium]|nr:NAD(P)-binding protein [Deltaproteobacteria bacterium]
MNHFAKKIVFCICCVSLGAAKCDDFPWDPADTDSTTVETDSDVDTMQDSDTGDVDVISGATPGVSRVALSDSHSGWGKSNCLSCHTTAHANDHAIGDCVTCHGGNNAPMRPLGHRDLGCKRCHMDAHPDMEVELDGCRACHEPAVQTGETCAYEENYDVVVIGAGGGGLAAAAMASRSGFKVLLVEQHYKTGGCMGAFKRGDYRFEESLHAFDGFGLAYLDALGISDVVTPVSGETMYRVITPGLTVDVPSNKMAYRDTLKATFPEEADNIDALFEGFTVMGPGFPGMTLTDVVASYGIEDNQLMAIFTVLSCFLALSPAAVPADAMTAMWDSYHLRGFHYFDGGSQSIVDALENVILENGGTIKRHTTATTITVENGRTTGIRTQDNGCYNASAVISNASGPATFLELLDETSLSKDFLDTVKAKQPASSRISMVFLGVDADYTQYFPEGSHEIFVNSGATAMEPGVDPNRCDPDKVDFIIGNYSVHDPGAAPPGKNAIVITGDNMDFDCNDSWEFDISYDTYSMYKNVMAEVLIARAEEYLPGLSEHIEFMEAASPRTIEQFTRNPRGSWMGWQMEAPREINVQGTTTPIDGLFMAGAWTRVGGQSVSLASGIEAAAAVSAYLSSAETTEPLK